MSKARSPVVPLSKTTGTRFCVMGVIENFRRLHFTACWRESKLGKQRRKDMVNLDSILILWSILWFYDVL